MAEVFTPPKQATIRSAPLNLRSGPGLSEGVVGRIENPGTPVKVLERQGDWVRIREGNQEGWVFQAMVAYTEGTPETKGRQEKVPPAKAKSPEPGTQAARTPQTGKTTGEQVRIRSGPALSSPEIGVVMEKGTSVQVLERSGDWYRIRFGDLEGWVFYSLLDVPEGAPAAPAAAAAAAAPPAASPEAPISKAPSPAPAAEPTPAPKEAPAQQPPPARVEPGAPPQTVLIKEITFSGNSVIDTATLNGVAEAYKGRDLTLEEMSELVDRITITYQEKGYILARAFLPKQDLSAGVLQISIMEGNVGKVVVTGTGLYDKDLVKGYFEAQLKEGVIKEKALEQGLLLANELPNTKTNVVLKKGEAPGDVDVVVNTEEKSRMTLGFEASFDYNNFGTELTSRNRYGVSMRLVDHKWGSITDLRGVMGDNIEDSGLGSVDFSVPVGPYGTRIGGGYLYGNYIVGQNFADLGLTGYTHIAGVNLTHPLLKRKTENLRFGMALEHKFTKNVILEQPRSIDSVGVFSTTLSYDSLDRFLGKNIFNAGLSFGEIHKDDQLATSRTNPDRHFESFHASYARVQKVYGYTNLFLRAAGQLSNDRLLPIEQFVIGGYGTVRGYDPSLYLGDSGFTLTGELMFAPPLISEAVLFNQRLAQMVQLALFYDQGRVYTNHPELGEEDTRALQGWGTGIRLFYKDRLSFKFDVAWPIMKIEGQDGIYYYVQAAYTLF